MKKITMMTAAMLCSIAGFAQTTLWDGENYELGSKGGCWDDGAPTVVENHHRRPKRNLLWRLLFETA